MCVGFERKHKNESENKSTEVQVLCASRTYTSLRTSWDHYNALLRHCHPALVNLCQGHTHIQFAFLLLHRSLANTISHIPPNWKFRYTYASHLHLLENTVTSKLQMCTNHELHKRTHAHTAWEFTFREGTQWGQDCLASYKHTGTKLVLHDLNVFTRCWGG